MNLGRHMIYGSILFLVLALTSIRPAVAQEAEDIIAELQEELELTDEQAQEVGQLMGKYKLQLDAAMAKDEDSEEDADPQAMISGMKQVRDAYRADLAKVLTKEQMEQYLALIDSIMREMTSDIAEIRLLDMRVEMDLTDEQIEELAPMIGDNLLGIIQTVIKYGDQKMNMRTKIKVGKALKGYQSDMEKGINAALTPEQQEKYAAYKEAKKAAQEG
jgi:hypothetical protein